MIDLRSDTFTLPSKEMLETILTAELGDDVWGEDPTTIELEALAAKKLGKEAGLLVTSGTQGNLVAHMTHVNRGEGIILEAESHIYMYESGGFSQITGAHPYLIKGQNGLMNPEDVEKYFTQPYNVHWAPATHLCVENTHNRGGGRVIPKENIDLLAKIAHEHGGSVHMDGARIFNASVATGIPASKLVEKMDSVQFCLSKGLGCPVGSMIVGSEEFIHIAKRNRRTVGGGMRQAGIIAAPGIYALNNMIDRLAEDHQNAKRLERALTEVPNLKIKPVDTNILIANTHETLWTANEIVTRFKDQGIKISQMGDYLFRLVTYYGVTKEQIDKVVEKIPKVFQ